jgi:prophage tail gpP-like protein
MPNPAEVAELSVKDQVFQDWESVWVQHRWMEGWPVFRFTAAEGSKLPQSWGALQFKPGDRCTIKLGGQLAITGIILTRQTSYDANNHIVELSGAGMQWAAATASIDSKDGNFDNKELMAIAKAICAPYGVDVQAVGEVDATPFYKCQAQPGDLVFPFLDNLARFRNVTLGSDHLGNLLLIGDHSNAIVQDLIEGENILRMQCIISCEMKAAIYSTVGQTPRSDDMSPGDAANQEATADGTLPMAKKIQTPAEWPVKSKDEISTRVAYERKFREGTEIRAFATVQGWLRDGSNLWRTGDDVFVQAPMAMINGMTLKIATATFQQDNQSGTTTVLELVLPWLLNDKPFGTTGIESQGPPGSPPKVVSDQPKQNPPIPAPVSPTPPDQIE